MKILGCLVASCAVPPVESGSQASVGDGAGPSEIWRLAAPIDPAATAVELAAVVDEAGFEAWDNNAGKNYACTRATSWTCIGDTLVTP